MSREKEQLKAVFKTIKKEWKNSKDPAQKDAGVTVLKDYLKDQLVTLQDELEDETGDTVTKYREWIQKKLKDNRQKSKELFVQQDAIDAKLQKAKRNSEHFERVYADSDYKAKPAEYDQAFKDLAAAQAELDQFKKANKSYFDQQDELREQHRQLILYEALDEAISSKEQASRSGRRTASSSETECLARSRTGLVLPDGFDRALCESQARASERVRKDGSATGEIRRGVGNSSSQKGL
jgi:hypothetical protein